MLCMATGVPIAVAANKDTPPRPKPIVSGYIFTDDSSDAVILLRDSLMGALGYHPSIVWKSPNVQLPPPNISAVDDALARVAKAQEFGKEGEIEKGLEELKTALQLLDENIYTLCTSTPKAIGKYINTLRRLSVFLFFSENKEETENILWRLFALNPGIEFKKFTKELKPLFTKIQKEHAAKGMTTLEITTDPPGAKVYYNFELQQNPAPVKIEEVPAGEAILLAILPGYEPRVERITVTPPAEGNVPISIRLQPTTLMQKLLPLRAEIDAATATPPILDAAIALSADIVAIFHLDAKGPREVVVHGALFDRRSKVRLSKRTQTMDPVAVKPEQVRAYVASLFDGVRLDGLTSTIKPPKTPQTKGFWPQLWTSMGKLPQKKYFWPVVGSTVGAIIVGTVVTTFLLQGENMDEYRRTRGSKVVLGF